MKTLALTLAVVISSQSSAASLVNSIKVLDKVLKPMLRKFGQTIEKDQLNRITQILTDKNQPQVSMLLRFSGADGGLEILDMRKARNIWGDDSSFDAGVIFLQNDASKELLKKLVDSGHSGIVFDKNWRTTHVVPFEYKGGDISFVDNTQAIKSSQSYLFKEENGVNKVVTKQHSAATDSHAAAVSESENTEVVGKETRQLTTVDLLAIAEEKLQSNELNEAIIRHIKEAIATSIAEATNTFPGRMIEPFAGEKMLWQDIAAYAKGKQSSAQRIKEILTEDKINELDDIFDGRLNRHLEGEEVLTNDDFIKLCRYTNICPWLTEGSELAIEQMLAIERLAFDHRKFMTEVGNLDYLDQFDTDLPNSAFEIISDADMVYRGEKIQLEQYKLHEVKTLSIAINDASLPENVQRVKDMLDDTDHIYYTETYISWLKSLDDKTLAKVEKRLKLWKTLDANKILKITDDDMRRNLIEADRRGIKIVTNPNKLSFEKSRIISDHWFVADDVGERGDKLRMNYAEYNEGVVLLNGSTEFSVKRTLKFGDTDPQHNALRKAEDIMGETEEGKKTVQGIRGGDLSQIQQSLEAKKQN